MKKLLVLLVAAMMLVGCATKPASSPKPDAAKAYKLGVGSATSMSYTDAGEKEGSVQANTTFAAVVLDADGKIVSVTLDTAQNTGKFSTAGLITSDKAAATPTKKEKQGDYGMKVASPIGKEWFEQVAALEAWMIGKTVAEVTGMPVGDSADGKHQGVSQVEDLKTSCTMTVTEFIAAVKAAADSAVEVKGMTKYGVGSSTSMSLTDAGEKEGSVQANTTYAVVALDKDGKVLLSSIDVAQNTGKFSVAGLVTSDKAAATPTKKEKQGDYGMKVASPIGKEWFEQTAAFEAYTVGKTVAEITGMPVGDSADGKHQGVSQVEDLKASCTMTITDFLAAIKLAADTAIEVK